MILTGPFVPASEMDPRIQKNEMDLISSTALFGPGVVISGSATVDVEVLIGARAQVGESARIQYQTTVGDGTKVGEHAVINAGCVIGDDVEVGNETKLRNAVTIASGLEIPPETQIGEYQVVPNNESLTTLGRFGASKRFVTIHGSFDGPRFSIGCQYSVSWDTIRKRIESGTETTPESAKSYHRYLDVFKRVGSLTQQAFMDDHKLAEELKKEAQELRQNRRGIIASA